MGDKQELGRAAVPRGHTFVMTERKAHHAWATLILDNPTAARLMHVMVAQMGPQNALVISQATLAKLMQCHVRTVQRAVAALVADRWIQRICIGGTVHGYVINDQIAWGERQAQRQHSVFSAAVVADRDDQDEADLQPRELRRLPMIYPPDELLQLHGEDPPGAQGHLPGMEHVIEGRRDLAPPGGDPDLDQISFLDGKTERERQS